MDRIEEQLTIWNEIYPYYKLKEPVILLEMFAGIGAQRKGLEILNIKVDLDEFGEYKISSIQK